MCVLFSRVRINVWRAYTDKHQECLYCLYNSLYRQVHGADGRKLKVLIIFTSDSIKIGLVLKIQEQNNRSRAYGNTQDAIKHTQQRPDLAITVAVKHTTECKWQTQRHPITKAKSSGWTGNVRSRSSRPEPPWVPFRFLSNWYLNIM